MQIIKSLQKLLCLQMWLLKHFNLKEFWINLEYNTITFEELSFPYSVPNGYNRVIIK
jgi:hypothetical protein